MPEIPGTLAEALIMLQARLPRITKDDTAAAYADRTVKYANLATITEAAFPVLAALGLYWTCRPTLTIEKFVLHYQLGHISGESIEGEWPLPTGNPQTMGGAVTYARRYAFCAVTGIAPAEDDDDAQTQADEARARQNMRTRAVADEAAMSPPPHARLAERVKGPAPDAADWETPDRDTPGSVTDAQNRRLKALFGKAGAVTHEDRMALAMSALDLPELSRSADLSFRQAEDLARYLQDKISTSGKGWE